MAGYLEEYGVEDTQRNRLIKRGLLALLAVVVVGLALFLFFRNFQERRVANAFLDAIRAKDYQRAHNIWGCTAANPCRDYKMDRFMQDWGPNGEYAKASEGRYSIEDACGPGVVFTLEIPGVEAVGIYVNRADKTMSFAPWPRCPGRHLHLWEFIKSRFS
jgi:hypothetical protein